MKLKGINEQEKRKVTKAKKKLGFVTLPFSRLFSAFLPVPRVSLFDSMNSGEMDAAQKFFEDVSYCCPALALGSLLPWVSGQSGS